jgi:hypothetical protein
MKKAGASMLLPKEAVVDELYNAIMTVSTAAGHGSDMTLP